MTETAEQGVDGRDSRWDNHRSARHELIINTAIRMIDAQGGDIGVVSISAESGVPRSVIYRLFKDRDDLDEQIRARILQDIVAALAPALRPSGSIRQAVTRSVRSYVRWVTSHPNLHRFLGEGSQTRPTHDSRAVYSAKSMFVRTLQDIIEALLPQVLGDQKIPQGTVANLAHGLVGMTDAVVNAWLVSGRERSSAANLTRYIVTAACGQFEAAAAMAGATIDLDVPL